MLKMDNTVSQKNKQTSSFISFRCTSCEQELEVQIEQAGSSSECPACGNPITIPCASEVGTLRSLQDPNNKIMSAAEIEAMKSRTIRIELSDDF